MGIKSILNQLSNEDGFSLGEVMITAMLLFFILSAAYLAQSTVASVSDGIIARNQAQLQGQLAIEKMTREIRMAQVVTDGAPNYNPYRLSQLGPTALSFYGDVDHNGHTDRVTYKLTNGVLYRSMSASPKASPLVSFTTDFGSDSSSTVLASVSPSTTTIFTYLDNTGASTAQQLSVCSVRIALSTIAKSGPATATVDFPVATADVRAFR